TFDRHPDNPCLHCIWNDQIGIECLGNCSEVGVLGVIPSAIGSIQAFEAIKLLLGWNQEGASRKTIVDLFSLQTTHFEMKKNPHCRYCNADTEQLLELFKNDHGHFGKFYDWEITIDSMDKVLDYKWIDIREGSERSGLSWERQSLHIPQREIAALAELNP